MIMIFCIHYQKLKKFYLIILDNLPNLIELNLIYFKANIDYIPDSLKTLIIKHYGEYTLNHFLNLPQGLEKNVIHDINNIKEYNSVVELIDKKIIFFIGRISAMFLFLFTNNKYTIYFRKIIYTD